MAEPVPAVAPVVETKVDVRAETLGELVALLKDTVSFDNNIKILNEDYRLSTAFTAFTKKEVDATCGKTSLVLLDGSKTKVSRVVTAKTKMLNQDMFLIDNVARQHWQGYNGVVSLESIHKEILAYINASSEKIVYVLSAELDAYGGISAKFKTLETNIGQHMDCHFLDKKNNYTYLGRLKLHGKNNVSIDVNGGKVQHTIYYFSL
jgi:hypothetical protein